MKNTKRVLAFLVGAAMMLPMASAEGKLASGDYEATSQGFGGAVTVKVTVTDGKVTAATITGDKETETIGGAAIKTLTEKLIGVSSADEVDAVASATVTSNAVKTALADCLRQAAGEEKTETALVDGVYTGEGRGFNLTQKVQVTVEIKDGKIVSVTVGDNGETMGMIAAVEEKWIPRVVENQSLAVDAICGATASSNGVRAAVVNALESAGMDVSGMYKAIPKVNAAEEYNVDIVVVGMGSSGTTAALAAAESGANVLAIDKAGKWGGTGVTTYGENIGVMAANRVYSTLLFVIAACFAILLGFSPKFGAVIQTIPQPILGGTSIVVFGLIAIAGARIWVVNQVDFGDNRNLIVAAVTLILGGGDFSLNLFGFTFGGIGTATFGAIILNAVMSRSRR